MGLGLENSVSFVPSARFSSPQVEVNGCLVMRGIRDGIFQINNTQGQEDVRLQECHPRFQEKETLHNDHNKEVHVSAQQQPF